MGFSIVPLWASNAVTRHRPVTRGNSVKLRKKRTDFFFFFFLMMGVMGRTLIATDMWKSRGKDRELWRGPSLGRASKSLCHVIITA